MGSPSRSNRPAGSGVVVVIATLVLCCPRAALAQADAGAPRRAMKPPPPSEHEDQPSPGDRPPGLKSIAPDQLSESVRARLQEHAAGRHPSQLQPEPRALHELPNISSGVSPPHVPARHLDEPRRRGEARLRRVQALETREGITLLSNRIATEVPQPRLASIVPRAPAPEPEPEPVESEELEDEPSAALAEGHITETHSLRALSSRTVTARTHSTGLGSLLWPFVLFVTTGAIVTTLWFRKKVD